MEVADRLWRDTSVFQERAQRTVAAYLAVVRALDDRRPPGVEAGELLALHRFVESLGPDVATAVFTDPYAVFWVRTAYALVHSVLGEGDLPADARALARELGTDDPRALLGFHLAQFKRLALGAAVAADAKLELAEPLEVALPTALPATRQALVGEGSLRLRGAADGRLIAADGGVFEQSPCPLVRVDDLEIPLQPYGYAFPGLGWQPLAVRSSLAYQQSQVALVQRGLALVARHQPATFAQIRRFIRWIAVNPTWEVNPLIFVSTSELLGAFAVFAYQVPHVIAFAAVHELHHNRLFCLEELDAIHESGPLGTNDDARFYSPWRGDPRPPRGIFHAIYVTIPETRFWLEAFRAGDLDQETRLVAVDRLVRFPLLLALGIRQLERCKRFTARGEACFRQLEEDVRRLREDVRAAGVPRDAPFAEYAIEGGSLLPPLLGPGGATLTSREMFVRHVRDFDRDRQIPDAWLDELLAS